MEPQHMLPLDEAQLLRIWVDDPQGRRPVLRLSLEDVTTGERRGFADLDALLCHLLWMIESVAGPVGAQ